MKKQLSAILAILFLTTAAWAGPEITVAPANQLLNTTNSPTFVAETLSGATASSILKTDANKKTASVTNGSEGQILTAHGAGTAPDFQDAPAGTVPDSGTSTTAALIADGAGGWSVSEAGQAHITNPKAMAQAVALTAAASGSSGITVADNDNLDMGTTNFGWGSILAVPDITPAADIILVQKHDGTNGWIFKVLTTGYLRLTVNTTNYDSTATLASLGVVDAGGMFPFFSVTRESASAAGSVVFGANGLQLGTSVAITAGVPTTVSNASALYILGTSAVRTAGTTSANYPINFAPTVDEWKQVFRNGIPEAWKWGSQTDLVSGWNLTSGWTTVATTTIDDLDSFTSTGAGGLQRTAGVIQYGKRYRITYEGNTTSSETKIYDVLGGSALVPIDGQVNQFTGTFANSFQFIAGQTVASGFPYLRNSGSGTTNITKFELRELGPTIALESEGIGPDGWKDSSTNGLNASYPTTGYSFTRSFSRMGAESLVSVTNVSLAADADTTIYTVPAGRRFVATKAILIVGADASTSVISIGQDTAETDWLPNQTLSAIDAANDVAILQPVPNATSVLSKSYAAGTAIQAKVSSHAGGATNALHLFGYLY